MHNRLPFEKFLVTFCPLYSVRELLHVGDDSFLSSESRSVRADIEKEKEQKSAKEETQTLSFVRHLIRLSLMTGFAEANLCQVEFFEGLCANLLQFDPTSTESPPKLSPCLGKFFSSPHLDVFDQETIHGEFAGSVAFLGIRMLRKQKEHRSLTRCTSCVQETTVCVPLERLEETSSLECSRCTDVLHSNSRLACVLDK